MAVNQDSTVALTGGSDCRAILVHLGTGKIVGIFENHTDAIEAVGFAPTYVRPLRAHSPALPRQSVTHSSVLAFGAQCARAHCRPLPCRRLAPTPPFPGCRMQLAATGGLDGKLCIWDLNAMRVRHVLQHAVWVRVRVAVG